MQSNACVDFEISAADMQVLKDIPQIKNYGEWSIFPVYGGKANGDGTYTARDFH